MNKPSLHILHHLPQITQRLRFQSHDRSGYRRFDVDLHPQVDLVVFSQPLDHMIDHVSRVGAMCGQPGAAGNEHHPRLLAGDIDPAGTPPPRGKVTLPVGAETAQVAKRGIERLIGLEQPHAPVSEVGKLRHGRRPHRLPHIFELNKLGDLISFQRYHRFPPSVCDW